MFLNFKNKHKECFEERILVPNETVTTNSSILLSRNIGKATDGLEKNRDGKNIEEMKLSDLRATH